MKKTKRAIVLSLTLSAVLALSSCGGGQRPNAANSQLPASESVETPDTVLPQPDPQPPDQQESTDVAEPVQKSEVKLLSDYNSDPTIGSMSAYESDIYNSGKLLRITTYDQSGNYDNCNYQALVINNRGEVVLEVLPDDYFECYQDFYILNGRYFDWENQTDITEKVSPLYDAATQKVEDENHTYFLSYSVERGINGNALQWELKDIDGAIIAHDSVSGVGIDSVGAKFLGGNRILIRVKEIYWIINTKPKQWERIPNEINELQNFDLLSANDNGYVYSYGDIIVICHPDWSTVCEITEDDVEDTHHIAYLQQPDNDIICVYFDTYSDHSPVYRWYDYRGNIVSELYLYDWENARNVGKPRNEFFFVNGSAPLYVNNSNGYFFTFIGLDGEFLFEPIATEDLSVKFNDSIRTYYNHYNKYMAKFNIGLIGNENKYFLINSKGDKLELLSFSLERHTYWVIFDNTLFYTIEGGGGALMDISDFIN
ncbi:MAG: hypothetical protein IJ072_07825 [Oscillospiraceae bacterium]|nr:hypothetical protein [Oscillospiraceae bacterium]